MDRSKWEYKKLGEVAKFINGDRGVNYPSQSDFVEVGVPFVNAGHLKNNAIDFSSMNYITREKFDKLGSGKIQKGDLLFCLRGSLGKKAIVDNIKEGAIASSLVILRPSAINTRFLSYYLESPLINDEIERSNNGSSQPNLSAKSVSQFLIPIPKYEDQQRIVAELDCLNEMIALKQEQLKEFDKLAQSIFYDMFGDPITNEKGWEKSSYGNEFVIGSGGTPSKSVAEYWEKGDIPWIGSNMCQNCDIYDNDGKYITQRGLDNSSAKVLKKGTILIALVGATIGKVGLLHKEMATNQNVAYINAWASGVFDPTFVFYHSMKLYQLFLNLGNGGFKMANQGFIKELPIILPPLALQQQFAEKIQAIEAQKELVKQSIAETQQLLDSRMDFYFD